MKAIFFSREDVEVLLPMEACIDVVADALEAVSSEAAVNPLRSATWFPDGSGLLGLMPGVMTDPPIAGIKIVTVVPGNHGTEFDSHQGAVLLFELEHGRPLAVVDASSITAIRTAAASGVATRVLAGAGARRLAILGSGAQAASHLEAMRVVRSIEGVAVWSRSEASARAFVDRARDRWGIDIHVAGTAEDAVRDADIVCTTTSSPDPVLRGAWLAEGSHVNAVGACLKKCRELDTEAVVRSRLYVDRLESALNEAGDFLIPRDEGAIDDDHIIGEIGAVLGGAVPGRVREDEITLFKSLGIAVEDLAASHYVYRCGIEAGRGVEVDL